MMKRHATTAALAALFVAAALSGCESEPSDQRIGDIDSVEADEPQNHAATRRLTIDQLEGAIPVVAGANAGGPIEWRLLNGQGVPTITALDDDVLGGTMGRPDYEYVTEEPASPDALYVKFSDDMARNVCHQMVEADVMRAAGEERVLTRFAAIDSTSDSQAIDDNISYLLLRFLGQPTPSKGGCPASIQPRRSPIS